jgi:uroporphyrinogen decarboxylase
VNALDRVHAAVRGERVDRVPLALWRHHPGADATAEELHRSIAAWQARWQWDLVKITPPSGFYYEPWGPRFTYVPNDQGVRTCLEDSRPVRGPGDWKKIRTLDTRVGIYAEVTRGTRLIAKDVGRSVPTLQTLFSPSAALMNLAGKDRFLSDARERPEALEPAFAAVTETTIAFIRDLADAGVGGIFFSTQLATPEYLTRDEYVRICSPYDRAVLDALRGTSLLVMLHIHGDGSYFDIFNGYYAHIVNWHDRSSPPALADGRRATGRCVAGGIDRRTLLGGTPASIREEVETAITTTGGRGVIVASNCVMLITTPEANIEAARDAVASA